MKKTIFVTVLLGLAVFTSALPVTPFQGWEDLIEKSPDIIVARCITTQDLLQPSPTVIYGNVFNSDIDVVSVLKGNSQLGPAHLASLYMPHRGEYFLAFATFSTNQTNKVYSATEDYRIVPILHFHGTNQLIGKTLKEQIGLLLTNRLNDVNEEMMRNAKEKLTIQQYLGIGDETNKVDKQSERPSGLPKDSKPFSF